MSFLEEIKLGLDLKSDALCRRLFEQHQSGSFCDVSLCIGKEKWIFMVHKAVMVANSPYFEAMFSSSFVEKTQEIVQIDPKSEIINTKESVESVLEFVYTSSISNPTVELLMEVCKVAQLWILDNLKKLAEYFLAANLSFDTCDILLEFSKNNDCKILYNSSLRFILANLDEIAISYEGKFNTDSSLFRELKALEILPYCDNEFEKMKKPCKESKTFVVFRKSKLDQYIFSGNLAKLTFPLESPDFQPVGLVYKISDTGIEISQFSIRLPNLIDLKLFGSKHCQEIVKSKVVSYAAIENDVYFGISNNNRFSGLLKYSIDFQTWDILPFIPGIIEARMTKTRTEYVTFFVKNTKEGMKLKVMNIQKSQFAFHETLLIIRSFEDGALVVEHEIPKINIPSGSLFYTSSPNVVQVCDELFFVFKYEILVLDAEGLFHCVTPRDVQIFDPSREDHRFYCVAVEEFEELLVVVHVKYNTEESVDMCYWQSENCKYRLNVFKYHMRKGYITIPQPFAADYNFKTLQTFYHEDTVYVCGTLNNDECFVQSYNVMLNCWKVEKKVSIEKTSEEYCYTNSFVVNSFKDNLFFK